MHRTLKAETAKPPRSSAQKQQEAFDLWRHEFNYERPHEALKMAVPADVYRSSPRSFVAEPADPDYPSHFEVRRVSTNGRTRIDASDLGISRTLATEAIGFEPLDDGFWQVWFGPIYLGLVTKQSHGKVTFSANRPYADQT